MSKARDLSDFISTASIDSTEIADGAVTSAKLHTTLDLSSKTLTFAADHISGNNIHGGVISDFASTGIDDNASSTAITIDSSNRVGIGGDPLNDLSVRSSSTNTTTISVQNTTNSALLNLHAFGGSTGVGSQYYNRVGLWSWNGSDGLDLVSGANSSGANDIKMYTNGYGTTPAVTINSSGHVGIGTTSPVYTLTVSEDGNDNIEIGAGIIQRYNRGSSSYGNLTYYGAAHNIISLSNDIKLESRSSDTSLNNGVTAKIELDTVGTGYGQIRMSTGGGGGGMNTDALIVHPAGYLELKSSDAYNQLVLTPSGTNAPASINFNTPGTGRAKLKVQNNEYISILSTGNVGIGTINPDVLLDVGNSDSGSAGVTGIQIQSSQDFSTVYAGNNSNTWPGIQVVNHDDTSNRTGVGVTFVHRSSSSGVASIQSTSDAADRADIRFITRGAGNAIAERVIIDYDGNVGIGRTSPTAKLDIAGVGNGDVQLRLSTGSNNSSDPLYSSEGGNIAFYQRQDGSTYRRHLDISSNGDNSWGGKIRFMTNHDSNGNSVERVIIDSEGNTHLKTNGVNTGQLRLEGRVHRVSSGRWYGIYKSKYDPGSTTSNVLRYNTWYWGDAGVIVEVFQRIYTGFHYGRFRLYGHTNYSNASVGVETLENTGVPVPYFSSIVNQTNDGTDRKSVV